MCSSNHCYRENFTKRIKPVHDLCSLRMNKAASSLWISLAKVPTPVFALDDRRNILYAVGSTNELYKYAFDQDVWLKDESIEPTQREPISPKLNALAIDTINNIIYFYVAPSIAKLEIKDDNKNQWKIIDTEGPPISTECNCCIIIKNEYHIIIEEEHLKFDNESNTFKQLHDFSYICKPFTGLIKVGD